MNRTVADDSAQAVLRSFPFLSNRLTACLRSCDNECIVFRKPLHIPQSPPRLSACMHRSAHLLTEIKCKIPSKSNSTQGDPTDSYRSAWPPSQEKKFNNTAGDLKSNLFHKWFLGYKWMGKKYIETFAALRFYGTV